LHHGLRGAAATRDQSFVRRLAQKLGFGFRTDRIDLSQLAQSRKLSLETAGRLARHNFFADCARAERASILLLAHHADDQVETILHNFLRGSGRRGLGGMREKSAWTHQGRKLEIWRPLLNWSREELRSYLRQNNQSWREDASNSSLDPIRNRFRHRIIPTIEKSLGRQISAPLLRLDQILREEDDWMDSLLPPRPAELPIQELNLLPLPLQRRQLLYWLQEQLPRLLGENKAPTIGWHEVETARTLLSRTSPAKINLPGHCHLRRRQGLLFLSPPKAAP
jgi:tRNA(Ile)-lysidine synthase